MRIYLCNSAKSFIPIGGPYSCVCAADTYRRPHHCGHQEGHGSLSRLEFVVLQNKQENEKNNLIIRLSKYIWKDKENYRVRRRTSCFIRPGESEDLAVQENSWRSHNSASEWFVYWAKDRIKIPVCSQLSKGRQNMQQQFRSNRTDLMTDTMWSSGPITMTWEAVAPVSSANAGR